MANQGAITLINKLDFSDPLHATDATLQNQWDRCNSLVLSWILGSISDELYSGQIFSTNGTHVWNELKETYNKIAVSIIYNLHHKINSIKQNENSLSDYYHSLNSLWKQYDCMITGPACTCGNVCNCPAGEFVKEQNKVQKLMQFLMGLNDCYMSVRSNILLRDPLLDVKSAYAILSREESHRNINLKENVITKSQTSAFIAQTSNKDMNFNNSSSRFNNGRGPNQNLKCKKSYKEASTSSSPLSFSNEQMMKLLSLINETLESSTQSSMVTDSCANRHMTLSEKGLFNLVNVSDLKLTIRQSNGTQALIKSIGNLKINDHITLFDVLVVPEYCVSLLSVHKLSKDNKLSVRFDDRRCYIQDLKDLKIKGTGKQDGGLYVFDDTHDSSFTANNCVSNCYASCKLWHVRLGHPSDQVLNVLKTKQKKRDLNIEPCEICHKAKQTRLPFPLSEQKTTNLGDLIHLDLWSPFKIQSKEGFKYFLTIIDDYSSAVWIYMLKSKEDVYDNVFSFVQLIENQFSKKVKIIRSDNGTKFLNNKMADFY
ncbi:uncharacterized protein [Rutidosis leptorrhynchoides]|uniref:uncharacterized protein n=1 Tax=Rutidosis leptorrhynchoides TaxID=125765 RepID=UPI003A993547